ncbi:MAG: class I SAM-dependent methyltransferase [Anaerolineae bacterium]|nr:class I SAM-dependent methyltransferase [Anaerolineae bacterium]MCO5199715.1 class I SAM-dependent methyltransferase [Anaerolineae bacterium]MCO5205970.1 class I SAM-dependent methyltransferase [Anaerolineae bacterium]
MNEVRYDIELFSQTLATVRKIMIRSAFLHRLINHTPLRKLLKDNQYVSRAYFNYVYLTSDPYQISKELSKEPGTNKYDQAFALLNGYHANNALEIGCGEGLLTHYLAEISDQVTAFDISDLAIQRAQKANDNATNIRYLQGDVRAIEFATGEFDLVFCSELLSYFPKEQLSDIVERIIAWVAPQSYLLLVHHRCQNDDDMGLALKEFGARTIHNTFIECSGFVTEGDELSPWYRLTLLHNTAQTR